MLVKAGDKLEENVGEDSYWKLYDDIRSEAYVKSIDNLLKKHGDLTVEDVADIVNDKRSGNPVKDGFRAQERASRTGK